MKNNRLWVTLGIFMLSGYAMPIKADFGVVKPESSSDYGNAETGSFHRAITGGGSMTPEEQAQLAKYLPEKDYDRYYGRIRLNFSTLMLNQIKNRSTDNDASGAVSKKHFSANQPGFEVAIGYSWSKDFRGDIEYLANRNLNYTANPALSGVSVAKQLSAQVKNNTLLANAYYDFQGLNRFRPYLTGGAGLAVNSVQATLTPGGSGTTRKMNFAWQVGAGFRVEIFSRWHLDASYRYIALGNPLNIKPTGNFRLVSSYNMNAISVGLIYLF